MEDTSPAINLKYPAAATIAALSVQRPLGGITTLMGDSFKMVSRSALLAATPPERIIVLASYCLAAMTVFLTMVSTTECWNDAQISGTLAGRPFSHIL